MGLGLGLSGQPGYAVQVNGSKGSVLAIDFRVLGPLEVVHDGVPLRLGGPRARTLLAALLIETDRFVSRDRLIDEVWADEPPATAENALQVQIAALRRLLPGRVETRGTAYRLVASPGEIDSRRFELAVSEAHPSLERQPAQAAAKLGSALEAWRGPALDGSATGRMASAEAIRLDALRRTTQIERADACLSLGENEAVIADLEGLLAGDPTDERLAARLMLAEYRGRGASEALATFARVRDAIERELAATPDTALLELRLAIERRDPTLAGPSAGLPVPVTRFVGRELELRETLALLGTSRLLTLTGPGGSGKSRLALELARAMAATRLAEVHLVSLAALPPGGSVTRLIADGLDVRERRGEPLIAGILSRLRNQRVLLVLDNCEHVLGTVAALSTELLEAAPGLRILATSREPLGAAGEVTWAVSGLGLPGPGASPADSLAAESMQLLLDRAAAARPGFDLSGPAVAHAVALCRRLDGLPLAIELAAARLRTLSLPAIVERLEGHMDLPAGRGDATPERHRTMRAAIDWSYDLLGADERRMLRRLAVFRGGVDLSGAMAVWGDPLPGADPFEALSRLVDQSMVVASPGPEGPASYRLLETIRQYAEERLAEAGEVDATRTMIITLFNDGAEKIFGFKAAEMIGRSIESLIPLRFLHSHKQHVQNFTGSPDALRAMNERGAIYGLRKDGTEFPAEASISKFEVEGEKVLTVRLRDVTEQRKAEEALKKSEATVRALLESASQGVVAVNPQGAIMLVNAKTEELFGYSRDEMLGQPIEMLLPQRFRGTHHHHRDGYFNQPRERPMGVGLDLSARRKNGSEFPVEISLSYVKSDEGTIAISFITDITERKRSEEQIRTSLEEKEVLLKEIHHRVKNNLQIVSSLLSLQSGYSREDVVRELFVESQNRVKSMALIHEKLYQSTDMANIDFADYIQSLARNLFHSYVANLETISLTTDVTVSLGIDHAIPCGLIINELLSNSLKYAFPGGRHGTISLSFHARDTVFELTFKDDGIGLPAGLDFRNTESLGLQIVNTLTEQLGGVIEHSGGSGTEFVIRFSDNQAKK